MDDLTSERQATRDDEDAIGLMQPEQTSQQNYAQAQNNACYELRTSTGYPLRSNQSLHARCAYMILGVQREIYYQRQNQLRMQKEHEMFLQLQNSKANEAVKIDQVDQ